MESIASHKELYQEFIRDIYPAEVLLIPELRFFIEKASSQQLKNIIKNHISDTRSHTSGLEEIQENLKANMLREHSRNLTS
jgi:ferritin-like metal-binding protein YciE